MWPRPQQPGHPSATSGNSENALAFSRKATASVIAHATDRVAGRAAQGGRGRSRRAAHGLFPVFMSPILRQRRRSGFEPERSSAAKLSPSRNGRSSPRPRPRSSKWACALPPAATRLRALVRERQDLAAFWRDRDKALVEALSKPEGQRNADAHRMKSASRSPTSEAGSPPSPDPSGQRVSRICGAGEPEASHGGGRSESAASDEALVFWLDRREKRAMSLR